MIRDLLIASYFGADGSTDAFLVAWTIPETAVPLLIDGAMALLLIPTFTRALSIGSDSPACDEAFTDPRVAVQSVVGAILPRLIVVLVVLSALAGCTAPWLVPLLAPGLANPELGVQAMQIVAGSVVLLGVAGFMSGALRAHMIFGPPAAVSLAFNVGIIGGILVLHRPLGVLAAAVGVTIGAALMVVVQAPSYLRTVPLPRQIVLRTVMVEFAAFLPIAFYTITRQSQVFIERFVGSSLPPGTISHLNYAQKIGQLPSTLAQILAVVTFPILARSLASGQTDAARTRMETDIRVIGAVVVLATAFLHLHAPEVVGALFQRGQFTATDTAATADILRIYVLGLLSQALVAIVVRTLFGARPTFLPAVAMGATLVVTAVVAGVAAPVFGGAGIAAGNAIGITVGAVLLFHRRGRSSAISPKAIALILLRLLPPVPLAYGAGLVLSGFTAGLPWVVSLPAGALLMAVVFGAGAVLSKALPMPGKRPK
ncbi:virulence factor MviN [Pseudonocardia sp. KRD-184]|uniref:Virulence factor MviN n=1 Tax=Pseudonocardia oceani TaxID=2792013 RepID=A0ABS6U5I2_9PSEU|nr:lipid II flippase MurJ [Pseudonocardia oceani]MBW0089582.1 virulence factor MviN [Pseudonocardia oceani]MBW0096508.1 virulence factor MviN [Pseudonocardia oceani]MBW0122751.1 virulence factor MviN [Pseudonocardia oceani]MBW0127478.1 virulence factor MviN [Pseudonocardia oceani]